MRAWSPLNGSTKVNRGIITMLRGWLLILAGMLCSVGGWAQSADHVEIFGGYSYAARDFSGGTIPTSALTRGWNASLSLKLNRSLGIVSDFAGYYNPENSSGLCSGE